MLQRLYRALQGPSTGVTVGGPVKRSGRSATLREFSSYSGVWTDHLSDVIIGAVSVAVNCSHWLDNGNLDDPVFT